MLLDNRDELALARPLFRRALAIFEDVHGPEHPDTIVVRKALGIVTARGGGPG